VGLPRNYHQKKDAKRHYQQYLYSRCNLDQNLKNHHNNLLVALPAPLVQQLLRFRLGQGASLVLQQRAQGASHLRTRLALGSTFTF